MIFDLAQHVQLPEGWQADLWKLMQDHGKHIVHDGRSPGSLEPDETAGLDYSVVAGQEAYTLPWLAELYHALPPLLSQVFGEEIHVRAHVPGRINVNLLRGGRYERHVDQNSHTAILFVDTIETRFGGGLAIHTSPDHVRLIQPVAGRLVAFPGARFPHEVLPLTRNAYRLSVPLSYNSVNWRDEPADAQLYGTN